MLRSRRRRAFVAAAVCALSLGACSSDVEERTKFPAAQARAVVDAAASGFQDAFRRDPGQRAVDSFAELLEGQETGTSDIVRVLDASATPDHGEIDLAVYRTSFPEWRDGAPNGSWSVRMCVTLVADGTTDARVAVQRRTCAGVPDPPTISVDATADY